MDGDESDVMKKFYEDVFGAFEELKIVEGSEDETSASRVAISRPAILEWYRGTPVSREDTAKALKEIAAKPSSSKVISRRRQKSSFKS
ncbi:unnamed protein product [Allacma fusca]|uniref:Uncharacterized protein n=1 Tax=Allacma fusca TaxID=39272 RepID=A0A8J2K477_9HEXA|nr:unnamed protein product [Allacma fusca]